MTGCVGAVAEWPWPKQWPPCAGGWGASTAVAALSARWQPLRQRSTSVASAPHTHTHTTSIVTSQHSTAATLHRHSKRHRTRNTQGTYTTRATWAARHAGADTRRHAAWATRLAAAVSFRATAGGSTGTRISGRQRRGLAAGAAHQHGASAVTGAPLAACTTVSPITRRRKLAGITRWSTGKSLAQAREYRWAERSAGLRVQSKPPQLRFPSHKGVASGPGRAQSTTQPRLEMRQFTGRGAEHQPGMPAPINHRRIWQQLFSMGPPAAASFCCARHLPSLA